MAVAMAFAIGLPSLRGSFPPSRRSSLAYGADIGLRVLVLEVVMDHGMTCRGLGTPVAVMPRPMPQFSMDQLVGGCCILRSPGRGDRQSHLIRSPAPARRRQQGPVG
jgi:hypothetical protein